MKVPFNNAEAEDSSTPHKSTQQILPSGKFLLSIEALSLSHETNQKQLQIFVCLLALALYFSSVEAKKSSSSGIGVSMETDDDNAAKKVGIALGSLFGSALFVRIHLCMLWWTC